MEILRTSYKVTKYGLEGTHTVEDERGKQHKVEFYQDRAGDYGWEQWGAITPVLGYCVEETERICNIFLNGELD